MRIALVKIGKLAYPEIGSLAQTYESRLRTQWRLERHEFKDDNAFLRRFGKRAPGEKRICLDEKGKAFSSPEFAAKLEAWKTGSAAKLVMFIIGGPMGLGDEIRSDCDEVWSLSRATFTSDIAWLILWEQLYRATNISQGGSYHHV